LPICSRIYEFSGAVGSSRQRENVLQPHVPPSLPKEMGYTLSLLLPREKKVWLTSFRTKHCRGRTFLYLWAMSPFSLYPVGYGVYQWAQGGLVIEGSLSERGMFHCLHSVLSTYSKKKTCASLGSLFKNKYRRTKKLSSGSISGA